jgi:hypothetical protein
MYDILFLLSFDVLIHHNFPHMLIQVTIVHKFVSILRNQCRDAKLLVNENITLL